MDNQIDDRLRALEDRLSRLERQLADLPGKSPEKKTFERKEEEEIAVGSEGSITFTEETPIVKKQGWLSEDYEFGESWLNWIGIGLLLIGVVFLFKYSIDQGWLIPPVRSACGLGIGIALLVAGYQIGPEKQTLKQILMGGGVAAFYITGFATFQLYNFLADPVIWVFMVTVTLLTLSLSTQQNEPILSVLGTAGGLGTPFMLYTDDGTLSILILYTCLILTGAGAIYYFKGWKSLLSTMILGGWLVLLSGVLDINTFTRADRWTLQAGAIFLGIMTWLMPVAREIILRKNPVKWPDPDQGPGSDPPKAASLLVQASSVITPLIVLTYSFGIWSISEQLWGAIVLTIALPVGYSYLPLKKAGMKKLPLVHSLTALILLTVALVLLLDGEILLIALTLEALALRVIAGRTSDWKISLASHILFGITGIWLIDRFVSGFGSNMPILNLDALTDLFIITVAGLVVPGYIEKDDEKNAYRLAAHICLLAWFVKELSYLENGQAFVTIAWGIYALVILFIGLGRNVTGFRLLGMATIFLVTGKLFLVDLSQIQTVVRILLFLGFGTLFLLVGYYLQNRWGDRFMPTDTESDN